MESWVKMQKKERTDASPAQHSKSLSALNPLSSLSPPAHNKANIGSFSSNKNGSINTGGDNKVGVQKQSIYSHSITEHSEMKTNPKQLNLHSHLTTSSSSSLQSTSSSPDISKPRILNLFKKPAHSIREDNQVLLKNHSDENNESAIKDEMIMGYDLCISA